MSSDDIASKVADRAGLDAGDIQGSGDVHDFVQQNNETDWEFLWRLARRIDYEVSVEDGALNFRPAGGPGGDPVPLRWGDDLWTFRPRVTGVQQVDYGDRARVGSVVQAGDRVEPASWPRPMPRSGSPATMSARPWAAALTCWPTARC